MNHIAYFEIQASNPAQLIAFYEGVFGWKFAKTGAPIEYYHIETGAMLGGLLKRPAPTPPLKSGTNAFTCTVEVDDYDACAQKILALGGLVAMPKFAVPGRCWQGYFVDPDHNTFGIMQVDPAAR